MTTVTASEQSVWIVVVQRSKATIFCSHGRRASMRVVGEVECLSGRMLTRSLESDDDRSRALEPVGHARHVLSIDKATREQEFACQLARRLDQAGMAGEFGRLILIADQGFLGKLRKLLSASTRRLLMLELAKEVLDPTAESVRRQLNGLARV